MKYKVGDRLTSSKEYLTRKGIKIPFKGLITKIINDTYTIRLTQSPGHPYLGVGRICEEDSNSIKDWVLESGPITLTSLYDKLYRERFTP